MEAWHRTSFPGKILARQLSRYKRWSDRIWSQLQQELDEKRQRELEVQYHECSGRIIYLSQAIVAAQKQRLAEREFDEWMKMVNDAKKEGNHQLLPAEIQAKRPLI